MSKKALKIFLIFSVWFVAIAAISNYKDEPKSAKAASFVQVVRHEGFGVQEQVEDQAISVEKVFVRVSHYWPPLGPPNCFESLWMNGACYSKIWGGKKDWKDYVDIGIACPPEWDFGTILVIEDREWICADRGGKIIFEEEIPWIDMLIEQPLYPYGQVVEAEIRQNKAGE